MRLTFETDYAFRPTPAGFLGIPEEYHAGLFEGSLQLVLRRCVTPNRWCIVEAQENPDVDGSWSAAGVVFRLDEQPDLVLFKEQDWSRARVDYGPAMRAYIPMASTNAFSDSGKPLWTRYAVIPEKVERLRKRREKAIKCADSFNAQFGTAPAALSELSNEALAVLCLQRCWVREFPHKEERTVWMHRSLADAVSQAVRAGYATVTADGSVISKDEDVDQALVVWAKRDLSLDWEEPEHIARRIEALRSHPRYGYSSFKGKYPDTEYGMHGIGYCTWVKLLPQNQ